jgi:hypothetical protein
VQHSEIGMMTKSSTSRWSAKRQLLLNAAGTAWCTLSSP